MSRIRLIAIASVSSAIVAGAVAATTFATGAAMGLQASVTRYLSPGGSDSGTCTSAKPCASLDRAYEVSKPGDVVLVGSGTYPGQTIEYDAAKEGAHCDGYTPGGDRSGCITFQAAPNAKPAFSGDIVVVGDAVRLVGFDLGGHGVSVNPGNVCHDPPTTNVILDGLTSTGGSSGYPLTIDAASYVADLNGNWSQTDGAVIVHRCRAGEGYEPNHIRFDHGWYHDVVDLTGNEHIECMHLDPADYVTITNSKFTNCAGYDVRISYEDGESDSVSHYLIENNLLAAACSQQGPPFWGQGGLCNPIEELEFDCSAQSSVSCDANTVRFNTIDGAVRFGTDEGKFTNSTYYGNLQTGAVDEYHCGLYRGDAGVAYHDNVLGAVPEGVACGPGSVTASNQLRSSLGARYDFRLLSPSVKAVGRVPQTVAGGYPALDYAGARRPRRAPLDAGAYQWDSSLVVLGRSLGSVSLGQPTTAAAAYGPVRRRTLVAGAKGVERIDFRLRRGRLWIYARAGHVVGVGTSSPYYATTAGVGAGAETALVEHWPATAWNECRSAFLRRLGGVDLLAFPAGGKRGKTIGSLTMIRHDVGFGTCPAAG